MLECGADPNVCYQYRNLLYDAIETQTLATIKVLLNPKYGFDLEKMIQLIEYESPSSAHKYKPMIETICLLTYTYSIDKGYQCLDVILKRLFGDGDRNGDDSTSTNINSKQIKFKPKITRKGIEGATKYSRLTGQVIDLVKRYLVIGNYSESICKMVHSVEYNYKIGVRLHKQISKLESFTHQRRTAGAFLRFCQAIIDENDNVLKKCIDIMNESVEKDKLYNENKLDWDYTFNQCLFSGMVGSSNHSLLWFVVDCYEKTATGDICMELIKLMLSLGADPNGFNSSSENDRKERQAEQSSHDDNVLLLACRQEKGIEVIKLLLDSGADVNSYHFTGQEHRTPLSYVSSYCDLELMQLLLEGGYGFNWNEMINIHQRDLEKRHGNEKSIIGRLSRANVKIGEIIKCIDYILSFQQKMIDQQDKKEKQKEKVLLHFGARDDRIELTQWDIIETISRHLHQYVGYENNKIVKQVFNELNSAGARLIFYFVKNGDIEMIQLLIQLFPERFNKTKTSQSIRSCRTANREHLSPLSVAILFNQKECVEWMENDAEYKEYFCHQDETTKENEKENSNEKKIDVDNVQSIEERMCELVSDEVLIRTFGTGNTI